MSDQDLIEFGIWRDIDDRLDENDQRAAGQAAAEAIEELREEGIEVEHVHSDVLKDEDGSTDCVYCRYRAPSEEAIREHSQRAGEKVDTDTFRVTKLTRMKARHEE